MALAVLASCSFDRGDRFLHSESDPAQPSCTEGARQCSGTLKECRSGVWTVVEDCPAEGKVCAPTLLQCTTCIPSGASCDGTDVITCAADGSVITARTPCDTANGVTCRDGRCVDLCNQAAERRSNVGCEYWAVDLDNADIDDSLNAAAQQFAVVVSNPQPDVGSVVTIEQDDTAVGAPNAPTETAKATVPPKSLLVFKLGPREVDGSPTGRFDAGSHTAVTRAAYRIQSTFPIIAYQFNPLENANVFSNDASLLKPVEALRVSGGMQATYVVAGWPQTIAVSDDPNTNFSTTAPINLRSFLTLVGTVEQTHVRVHTKAKIVGGGPVPATAQGGVVDYVLNPFDVLNLETGSFGADFTGSVVESDSAVVVFSGSEAADAPAWKRLAERQCCADHLEEQLDPIRTAGKQFVATYSPNRSDAVHAAGVTTLAHYDANEYHRVIAATPRGAVVTTSLPPPNDHIVLSGLGDFAQIDSKVDFVVSSSEPITLASVSPSQGASGVPARLPGGDPSLLVMPPLEQFRSDYVFLLPDKYAFDFIRIIAADKTKIRLDDQDVTALPNCRSTAVTPLSGSEDHWVVWRCQMSFPVVDLASTATTPVGAGVQNDGVHQIVATDKVGVLVDGFDRNVSYAYAAGTELTEIVPR